MFWICVNLYTVFFNRVYHNRTLGNSEYVYGEILKQLYV